MPPLYTMARPHRRTRDSGARFALRANSELIKARLKFQTDQLPWVGLSDGAEIDCSQSHDQKKWLYGRDTAVKACATRCVHLRGKALVSPRHTDAPSAAWASGAPASRELFLPVTGAGGPLHAS